MKKDFKNNLIEKIKKEKIKPISKYFFVMKKISIYLFLGISILIGALSVAIVFGYLFEADWFLSHRLGFLKITMNFLPIFWIGFLIISVIISYFNFKNTKKGYKFYLYQIVLLNILSSIVIGTLFYITGFSQFIEEKIQNNLPEYRQHFVQNNISRMRQIWQNEEKGLLLGVILSTENLDSLHSFKLKDTNNKVWKILILEETNIRHNLELKKLLKIKLVGKKQLKNIFEASEIRPLLRDRRGYKENH